MRLGMSHSSEDDELFQRLTPLLNQIESARRAIELVASAAHRHRVKWFRDRADRDRLLL
jgi:hypothetical protein